MAKKKEGEYCTTCGHKLSGKKAAEFKKKREEFEKGLGDAIAGRPSVPTSLDYIHGYERGRGMLAISSQK